MFLHDGKEYYPLEVEKIVTKDGTTVYDRRTRGKSYIYIDVNTQESE